MHILFLADASSPHSYRWIKFFSEQKGIKVSWCSFSDNTMPRLENVEIKILKKNNPIELLKSIRYILNISPDLIHVHYLGWNGFLSLFFPKIPTVLTAWGSDIVFNSKNFIMKFLIKRMIKQSTVITCDAFHLKERLVELGSDTEKVKIIMFGINEDEFNYQRRPFELKNNHDKYIVGSIRNLHPVYDVITFLKAAKEVLKTREDVVFHVAGSGPDLKSLENFVEKHALQKHINFIGRLNSNQLLEFYESLDVYVSTSLSDGGIASSTAEAMLCQRPAIITNAAENGFWIEDQVNGRLFDCSDHINLSKIINNLLDNKSDALKLGEKGQETIISRNSYKNEMTKMINIYKSCI